MLTHTQLKKTAQAMEFMRFCFPYGGDMVIAFCGATMVAIQYSDRSTDPRTGYAVTEKQPVTDLSWVSTAAAEALYRISRATSIDDNPQHGVTHRDEWRKQVLYAYEVYETGVDAGLFTTVPEWSVITDQTSNGMVPPIHMTKPNPVDGTSKNEYTQEVTHEPAAKKARRKTGTTKGQEQETHPL